MNDIEIFKAVEFIDNFFVKKGDKHLDTLSTKIIKKILKGDTYQEIADSLGYESGYIGDKARKIFKTLSVCLGDSVDKSNFYWIIEMRMKNENKKCDSKNRILKRKRVKGELIVG